MGVNLAAAQHHRMGFRLDPKRYAEIPLSAPLMRGATYDSLPSSYSLKQFFPTPGDQGEYVTSPAWAAAYAGFTAMRAIEAGVLKQKQVDSMSFSPSFVYNLVRDPSDKDCQTPVSIIDILEAMKNHGVLRLMDFPYQCNQRIEDRDKERAAESRISGYKRLFEEDCTSKEYALRKAVVENKPVIVGLYVARSIDDADEVWEPEAEERENLNLAQAMTIVGYDDYKYGGAFELINSWGTNWGNDGYIWIRYRDMNHFCSSAYEIILDPPVELVADKHDDETVKEPNTATLHGSARMVHISGVVMPAVMRDGVFLLQQPHPSGTRFRVEVSTKQECYVYAFASDSTHLKMYQIFPNKKSNTSPHFDGRGTFLIPGPTEDYYSMLDNTIGTDYYCILFCRKELDIARILRDLENAQGDFYIRLKHVLGDDIVPEYKISNSGEQDMGVTTTDVNHPIVPLFIEMRHISGIAQSVQSDRTPPQIALIEPAVNPFKKNADGSEEVFPVMGSSIRLRGQAQDESSIKKILVNDTEVSYTADGHFEAVVELTKQGVNTITITATDDKGHSAVNSYKVLRR
jgi:hypothetical protein